MADIKISGTVKEIEGLKQSTSGFKTQEIAVDEGGQFGTVIPIKFLGDKGVAIVASLKVNQKITVVCNLKGSLYSERRFINLEGWKLE